MIFSDLVTIWYRKLLANTSKNYWGLALLFMFIYQTIWEVNVSHNNTIPDSIHHPDLIDLIIHYPSIHLEQTQRAKPKAGGKGSFFHPFLKCICPQQILFDPYFWFFLSLPPFRSFTCNGTSLSYISPFQVAIAYNLYHFNSRHDF